MMPHQAHLWLRNTITNSAELADDSTCWHLPSPPAPQACAGILHTALHAHACAGAFNLLGTRGGSESCIPGCRENGIAPRTRECFVSSNYHFSILWKRKLSLREPVTCPQTSGHQVMRLPVASSTRNLWVTASSQVLSSLGPLTREPPAPWAESRGGKTHTGGRCCGKGAGCWWGRVAGPEVSLSRVRNRWLCRCLH